MTNIPPRYEYHGVVENEKGEPVAEFRHGEPNFLERRFAPNAELPAPIKLTLREVLISLDEELRRPPVVGIRPETMLVYSAVRDHKIWVLEQAKREIVSWPDKPQPLPTSYNKFAWKDFSIGAFVASGICALASITPVTSTPNIGVRFDAGGIANASTRAASVAARDLGALPEKTLLDACRASVLDWEDGGKGISVVKIPSRTDVVGEAQKRTRFTEILKLN